MNLFVFINVIVEIVSKRRKIVTKRMLILIIILILGRLKIELASPVPFFRNLSGDYFREPLA